MGWLIAAVVLLLLGILPVGVRLIYDSSGPRAWLLTGPTRFLLYPREKTAKPEKKDEKTQKESKAQSKKSGGTGKKTGGNLTDFLPFLEIVWDFLSAFRGKLRVKRLEMKLILAGGDPCALAENYGKAWAVLGNLMPLLERMLVIRKRDLEVECDFTAEKTLIFAHLDITITVARTLGLAAVYGIRLLGQYLKLLKSRKGGAKS